MRYQLELEIDAPREQVVQSLADPEHLSKWARELVLHEPLNGVHGHVGTRSRVVMRMGNQEIECVETVTRREPVDLQDIPKEAVVYFDRDLVSKGMSGVQRDRLTEANPNTTLWSSESEYRFTGLLMRLVGPFMTGAFRKQSLLHMEDFKAFIEQGKDVREATG